MKHKKNLPHDYWVAKANEKRKFFTTGIEREAQTYCWDYLRKIEEDLKKRQASITHKKG